MTPNTLTPGALLDGKYEILGLLGAGGMGEVYKARHIHLGALRCIKVMKTTIMEEEANRQRFLREARLATQIHHPNIAVVHDFSMLPNGASYMVTEFIDGTTVRQWSAVHGRFPLALAADVAVQVLEGLDFIHRRGLLHRDISADNVMLAWDSERHLTVKIIDLGVAKDIGQLSNTSNTTQAGMLIGNPKYMSPEQLGELEDGEQLDGRCDLYSFGVVLYEMLTGVSPFIARTPSGYIIKHLTQPPPPLRESNPAVSLPEALERTVFRALEKKRNRRWSNAREFAAALAPFRERTPGTFTQSDVVGMLAVEDTMIVTPVPQLVKSGAATGRLSDEEAFQTAWEDGHPGAWEEFLRAFAGSPLVPRAQEALAEARAFERAVTAESVTALRSFVEQFPEGLHRLEAEMRAAELEEKLAEAAWAHAQESDSYTAFRAFRAKYPSYHAEEAERALDERMAYESASALDTEEAWTEYLETWEGDRHAPMAAARLEAARGREETAFTVALQAKSAAAWKAYLDEFPDSKRSARAEANRMEAIAFGSALYTGAEALQDFIRQHPNGLLLDDARAALALMESDGRDFDEAWEAGTTTAWDAYLARHPHSARITDARHCRQEAAEYELAQTMNTPTMWRAFVKAWPDGRHRLDAELRVKT